MTKLIDRVTQEDVENAWHKTKITIVVTWLVLLFIVLHNFV